LIKTFELLHLKTNPKIESAKGGLFLSRKTALGSRKIFRSVKQATKFARVKQHYAKIKQICHAIFAFFDLTRPFFRFRLRLALSKNFFKKTMNQTERNALIELYAAGADEVNDAISGFTPEMLTAKPFAGKWSAAEIVQHLADSEMNSAIRLRKLLAEDFPVIVGYDQDVYAEKLDYNDREIAPALEAFRGARATSLQILRCLTDSDWQREGWHTESGRYSVEKWLEIYAAHAHNHAVQIRCLRDALV
jgi:hypothetical protein